MRRGGSLLAALAIAGTLIAIGGGTAGATTVTFTSTQVGTSGSTPVFTMAGPWTMQWSYHGCGTATVGIATGNFIVTVNQPSNDVQNDTAPNELGTSGSGVDHYYDTGSFNLSVLSTCSWSITVASSSSGDAAMPATFTSASIGKSGSTQEFHVTGTWTMHWSYNSCTGGTGNFIVTIQQLTGGLSFDVGPNELGTGGSGADTYTTPGTFNLEVLSECAWSITVGGVAPAPPAPAFTTFTRVYGQTPDATAAQALQHRFQYGLGDCVGTPTARTVLLATDSHYPDALAGSYLAGNLSTGILLTPPTSLPSATVTALRDEGVTSVIVLGGPLAVTTAVIGQLRSLPVYACGGASTIPGKTMTVSRLYGQTQYTTAEKIAESLATKVATDPTVLGSLAFPNAYAGTNTSGGQGRFNDTSGHASSASGSGSARTAILATGQAFQDAMAAGAVAYAEHLPILLTTPTALSPQAASAISSLGVGQVIVMGGPLAVSNTVVSSLEALGVSVLRIAGQSYTDTSVQLAKFESSTTTSGLGWIGTGSVTIARGNGFTDGLAGADIPGSAEEPMLLTQSPTVVGTTLADFLRIAGTTGIGGQPVTYFMILGGPLAITQTTINSMGADL